MNDPVTRAEMGIREALETVDRLAPETSTAIPDPIKVQAERTINLVKGIGTNSRLEIARRRDELDNLAERMLVAERALIQYINEYAARNIENMEIANDIRKLIENATMPFRNDPPATITQATNGETGGPK